MNMTLSIPIISTSEMNLKNNHYIFHKERKESFHPFSSYLGTSLLEEGKQQDQEAPNQCSHLRRSCLALFRAGKRDQQFRRSKQHRTQGWSQISSFLATRCPICHSQLLCFYQAHKFESSQTRFLVHLPIASTTGQVLSIKRSFSTLEPGVHFPAFAPFIKSSKTNATSDLQIL